MQDNRYCGRIWSRIEGGTLPYPGDRDPTTVDAVQICGFNDRDVVRNDNKQNDDESLIMKATFYATNPKGDKRLKSMLDFTVDSVEKVFERLYSANRALQHSLRSVDEQLLETGLVFDLVKRLEQEVKSKMQD